MVLVEVGFADQGVGIGEHQAGLVLGARAPALVGAPPPAPPPAVPLPPAVIAAPVVGPPPGGGETIAALIHAGGPTGLHSAEQQLQQQAKALSATAAQLGTSSSARNQLDLSSR